MTGSVVGRVAAGAALAAAVAALVAALGTILFASVLMQNAEDRRIEEASVTFAAELDHEGHDLAAIEEVHRDESEELDHTGMLFAVYDGEDRLLVGDHRLALPATTGCSTTRSGALRVCRAASQSGLSAVVGAARTSFLPLLAGAALLAALLAAVLAWFASRPISRRVVAPLTRLRERIALLDVETMSAGDLGPDEHTAEVDELRHTIRQLIVRVESALAQAHRFAANAAHELRTPLTSVRGELELLAEGIAEPTAREGAALVQQKVDELSVLVERLLILSLPARSVADAEELVSLRDLLEDAVRDLEPSERARAHPTESDALVRGDAVLLGTMVVNAIANGLKFGSRVDTEIRLSGGTAVLHIDDDGAGVDAAERERVFEPFFRSNDALRRRVPGHGLGLALIRHIAETHGGTARFVDKPSGGARLEIRLPATQATA